MKTELRLTLYVAGQTTSAERSLRNLREILQANDGIDCHFTVVNVLERPDLAEEALILATPTLVKESPLPSRRLIGDLSATDNVLRALHIDMPST